MKSWFPRLTDGCYLNPHPQDIIDHAGTPLGDELLMMRLNQNVHIAMALVERERAKHFWSWLFGWLV